MRLIEFLHAAYLERFPRREVSLAVFEADYYPEYVRAAQAYTDQEVAAALAEAKPQTEDPEKVRREIATAAMQGILAANVGNTAEGKVKYAVGLADALIAELAKKKGGENA